MKYLAFDCETTPITHDERLPRPVCVSVSESADAGKVLAPLVGVGKIVDAVAAGYTLVGHNLAFDVGVLCRHVPDLWPHVRTAYDEGRVWDTMLQEQLIAITKGKLYKQKYSLAALAERYLKIELAKGEDTWRMRYGELEGIPPNQWPKEAYEYAQKDAETTFAVRELQGPSKPDLVLQCKAALALLHITARGLKVDRQRVADLQRQLMAELDLHGHTLEQQGLLKRDKHGKWQKNLKAIRAHISDKVPKHKIKLTNKFEPERQRLLNTIEAAQANLEETHPQSEQVDALKARLSDIRTRRDALRSQGGPEYERLFFEAREISQQVQKIESKQELESRISLAQYHLEDMLKSATIATGRDNLELAGLQTLIRYGECEKLLGTYIKALHNDTIHPEYHVLKESGRTSSVRPNIQNLPRETDIRSCIVARPGKVLIACDYDGAELRALAQVCYKMGFGRRMLDAINEGKDLHLELAGKLLGVENPDKSDPAVKAARQKAKCFHPDTEVLTRTGWRKITDLAEGEEVIQAVPGEDYQVHLEWSVPTEVFTMHHPSGELIHLKNEGMDLRVTPDHRMLAYNAKGKPLVTDPVNLNKKRGWANAGRLPGEIEIDEALLRLAVATQADGSFATWGVRFGFTKARKVGRLRALLKAIDPDKRGWTESQRPINGKTGTFFALRGELADTVMAMIPDKRFPWDWLNLTERCREVVLDEARYWDGTQAPHWRMYQYCSTDSQSLDVLQAIASVTGRKTRLTPSEGVRPDHHKPHYRLTVRHKGNSRGENLSTISHSFTDEVACLTVPSSFVLVRDGGIPAIVGQSSNFGFPGGMGVKRFVESQGGLISHEVAEELRAAWFAAWPEMRPYFAYVSDCTSEHGKIRQYHPETKAWRIRGGVTFCQAANTLFQGLVADAAKEAAWILHCAGFDVVAFIHDEFIVEVPEERCDESAREIERIMITSASKYMPDVKITASAHAMRRWHKEAQPVRVDGKLVPWEKNEN